MAARALTIAADPELSRAAARRFLMGMRSAETVRAESAKVRTLSVLVEASGGGALLPLTPAALEVPPGALREAGYRAGSAYLGAARRLHVRLGHPLSPQLVM